MTTLSSFLLITVTSYFVRSQKYEPCQKDKPKPIPCNPTCCFDTIKCQDIDGKQPYLGADSVVAVYFGNATDKPYYNHPTGIGIHVSYRFYSVQFKRVSRYLQPQRDSMLGYWHPNPKGLDGLKPYKVLQPICDDKYETPGDWGTGCSSTSETVSNVVATLQWKNRQILVCGNFISVVVYIWVSPRFCPIKYENTNRTVTINRGEGCEKTEYKPLCLMEGFDLIDAFTLPDGKGNEIMIAYYGESQITNPGDYRREYKIYTWDGTNFEQYENKFEGELSAIDIFEIEKDAKENPIAAYGLYFTNSGEVCPFKHVIGETNYDFEHSKPPINIPCRSLQTFIACPQAWCVDAFLDASFTIIDKDDKEQVYLTLFKNMWVVESKPLPLDVPLVRDHILIDPTLNNECKYRYPNEERKKYHESKGIFKCVISDALAAFTYTLDGEQYMYNVFGYLEKNNWHMIHDGQRHWDQHYTYLSTSDFLKEVPLPDAAWFDQKSQLLYLFKGSTFHKYKFEGEPKSDKFKATHVGKGTTEDLGLIYDNEPENGIGAVVSMNGSNYFFNQRFRFMEIKDGETKVTGEPRFIQQHFFRVMSQCYYNDLDGWNELLAKNGELNISRVDINIKTAEYSAATLGPQKTSIAPYQIMIVAIGVIITIVGLIVMFVIGQRKPDVWQTKTVTKYESPISKKRSLVGTSRKILSRSKTRRTTPVLEPLRPSRGRPASTSARTSKMDSRKSPSKASSTSFKSSSSSLRLDKQLSKGKVNENRRKL